MRKSKTHNFRVPAFLAFGFLFAVSSAWADSVEQIKERLVGLDQTIAGQNSQIQEASKQLDRVSAEIHVIKTRQGNNPTLLQQYRLQTRLRQAQEISDRLAQLTETKDEAEKSRQHVRRMLVAELDQTIEGRRNVANSNSENLKNRSTAAREMERLFLERMRISAELSSPALPANSASLFRTETLADDNQERVTALRDLEGRMKNEVTWLQSELAEAKRQRFLRNEVTHLMDEEAFFAEQGFVRGGPARSGTISDTLAKGKTPSDPTTAAAAPSVASPPSSASAVPADSAPALRPDTRSKVGPISSDTTSALPTSLKNERDPLAQLASEFGLPPEQKRDVQVRTATTDGQIQWLENRISKIRLILDRLRLKTQELEKPSLLQ